MCRAEIPQSFEPKIDTEFQKKLKNIYHGDYDAHMKELEKLGVLKCQEIQIEFEIGNKYEKIEPKEYNGNMIEHKITSFVRFKDASLGPLINTFVHDVKFGMCLCPNDNCQN